MNEMKKRWEEPKIMVQEFLPNEYVAVCWSVGCSNNTTFHHHCSNAPYGNQWSGTEGPYDEVFSHDGSCRNPENNYFSGNADGSGLRFVNEDSSDQGYLTGGFDKWIDANNNGIVDTRDVIYWYTDNGGRRWNHWGYVQSTSSHPLRS